MSLLLAEKWNPNADPTGYWMSEKLDGVRAEWRGKNFYSRTGKLYHAPKWFRNAMPPDINLDGELFIDRGCFEEVVGIVRRTVPDEGWERVYFHLFDVMKAPGIDEHKSPFEDRMKTMEELARQYPDRIRLVQQVRCESQKHMESELDLVLHPKKRKRDEEPGEGLMLRAPGSLYQRKRSKTLLKVKQFHDAEAKVIGTERGKGRHLGRMGALKVRWKGPNGNVEFKVGSGFTDKERNRPPRIGCMITFKYQELTKYGVPRFPTFLRERPCEDPQ